MSSYGPESSSIEKFIISATFFIFIMSSYLSPIQSYNPFSDKIYAFNELSSHLPHEELPMLCIQQLYCKQLCRSHYVFNFQIFMFHELSDFSQSFGGFWSRVRLG